MCVHLVDAPVLGDVKAVLVSGEPLHLQDPGCDGQGGQVDPGTGLLKAHRLIHSREGDTRVPCTVTMVTERERKKEGERGKNVREQREEDSEREREREKYDILSIQGQN